MRLSNSILDNPNLELYNIAKCMFETASCTALADGLPDYTDFPQGLVSVGQDIYVAVCYFFVVDI